MTVLSDKPRALITGINGFTGRHLAARLLSEGYDVVGLAQSDSENSDNVYGCDLLDAEHLRMVVDEAQPDVVAHLAAISFVAHSDVESIYRTNVVGTRNLLAALAASRHQPASVLLASSANVYGNARVDAIDESVPFNPANDYAVSKVAMEYMARQWMSDLPIVITRPFNYTGVGQADRFLLPKIVKHFKEGKEAIELGNLDVARDFSDVRTVVDAYARLLEASPSDEAFNICSGEATSLKQVIQLMEDISGYEIDVRVNPAFVRASEVKRLCGSNAKLVEAVGAIEPISLKDTLQRMYRY
ncbi:GDP-mannose 4,6-dehydratase [Spiribacter sp. 221]|uniref:GDP-mannose 4,6-dehydratase n=1 Tax=Spiribacter onubensis TaxID=3122420 RepID=UPI00349F05B5